MRTNLGLATEARADQLRASRAGQARLLLHQARQAIAPCVDRDAPRTDPDEDPVDDPIEDPVDDPVDAEVLAALPDEVRTALAAQDVRLVDKILDAAAEAVAVPDPQRPVTGREARFEDLTPPEQQEVLEQRNEVARERRRQQQESRDPQRRRPPPEDPRTYNW